MGDSCPRAQQAKGAKQPHQKYCITNDHKSEFVEVFWMINRLNIARHKNAGELTVHIVSLSIGTHGSVARGYSTVLETFRDQGLVSFSSSIKPNYFVHKLYTTVCSMTWDAGYCRSNSDFVFYTVVPIHSRLQSAYRRIPQRQHYYGSCRTST